MKTSRRCEVCESDKKVAFNSKTGKLLCGKHRAQIGKYGEILKRTKFDKNELVILKDCIEIKLYKNNNYDTSAFVSLNKIDLVSRYKWNRRPDGYIEAKSIDGTRRSILLHRVLCGKEKCGREFIVDHENGNKLDNLDSNLRIGNNSGNQVNKNKMKNNTSGAVGVTWDESRRKWKTGLNHNGKTHNLGRFTDFEDAVRVRLKGELEIQGEYSPRYTELIKLNLDLMSLEDMLKIKTNREE